MSNNKITDLLEDLQDTLENSILNKSGGAENKENETVSELFDTLNKKTADSGENYDSELKISKAIPTPSVFDEALIKNHNKYKSKSSRGSGSGSFSDTKEVPAKEKSSEESSFGEAEEIEEAREEEKEGAIEGEKTVKDGVTGLPVTLYPPFLEEDKGLLFYHNDRFGYSMRIPEMFKKVVLLSENEDGIILESVDGKATFRVSGGFAMDENQLQTSMEAAKKHVEENVGEAVFFHEITGDDWWELTWVNGLEEGRRKFVTNGEVWCECEITWSREPDRAPGEYDELFDRSLSTMSFPVG
ncbi:MAG: hypothetical protein FWG09_07800 [Synergistaceae bacterium]|nr:hypothetical protein [Synergistaceae bacterium]